jgi:predicted ATPase
MSGIGFIGRESELQQLLDVGEQVLAGNGSTVFLSGEAGIGKSRLTQEFEYILSKKGIKIMKGLCLPDSLMPLLPINEALRGGGLYHIATGSAPPKIQWLYLINNSGMLVSQYSRSEGGLDSDIFAGMLTAVENFVKDSLEGLDGGTGGALAGSGGAGAGSDNAASGLTSMGYGEYTIVLEHIGGLNSISLQ